MQIPYKRYYALIICIITFGLGAYYSYLKKNGVLSLGVIALLMSGGLVVPLYVLKVPPLLIGIIYLGSAQLIYSSESKAKASFVYTLPVLGVALCICLFAVAEAAHAYKFGCMAKWPTVIGQVVTSSAEKWHDLTLNANRYDFACHYKYVVNGINYQSDRIDDSVYKDGKDIPCNTEAAANKKLEVYAPGNSIVVHYDLNNPQYSVLFTDCSLEEPGSLLQTQP
jgi:uncharacterized protein (DUF486 family)